MNREVLVVVIGLSVAALLATAYLSNPTEPPDTTAAVRDTPAPAPGVRPRPPRRAPEPPASSPARAPRRAVEPAPERAQPEAAPVEAAPEMGTLRIESDVPGAQVFIDRQFIGAAPVTASGLKPGTHQLNVSAEGFDGIAQTIDVEPGPRDLMIRLREVRLDAKLDVVHKHRVGSCRGQLVATAQGLRYETPDTDDRFNATLTDLDTFQIDYLEKNLRVKLRRGGRQFNFTDPEGNADRLLVFHRDVEKARDRMRKGDQPAS